MQAVLVMFRSDGERRSFSIARDMTVIGRREDCDLRIPLGDISRKHCRLVREEESLKLEDLGSSNGTYLNGQRIQEAVLSPGDTIQIGPVVFVVQLDGVPGDDELQPVGVTTYASGEEPAADEMGEEAAVYDQQDHSQEGYPAEPATEGEHAGFVEGEPAHAQSEPTVDEDAPPAHHGEATHLEAGADEDELVLDNASPDDHAAPPEEHGEAGAEHGEMLAENDLFPSSEEPDELTLDHIEPDPHHQN